MPAQNDTKFDFQNFAGFVVSGRAYIFVGHPMKMPVLI